MVSREHQGLARGTTLEAVVPLEGDDIPNVATGDHLTHGFVPGTPKGRAGMVHGSESVCVVCVLRVCCVCGGVWGRGGGGNRTHSTETWSWAPRQTPCITGLSKHAHTRADEGWAGHRTSLRRACTVATKTHACTFEHQLLDVRWEEASPHGLHHQHALVLGGLQHHCCLTGRHCEWLLAQDMLACQQCQGPGEW